VTIVKFLLGLQIYPSERPCPKCSTTLDVFGHHAVVCRANTDLTSRHNAIRDCLWRFVQSSGFSTCREKLGILGDTGGRRRPADVLIQNFRLSKDFCIDVAVTSPLLSNVVNKASTTPGIAAELYTAKKNSKYRADVEKSGKMFVPMVAETFGRWHSTALELLNSLARSHSLLDQTNPSPITKSRSILFQNMSLTLQLWNSLAILDRAPRTQNI
jgi:hypothetical protein